MAGLLILGVILAALGLSIMSGLMQVLMNLAGNILIFGGIIAAVAGGAAMLFSSVAGKAVGFGLLILGVVVAVMGAIMKFVLYLWFVSWLIAFGGIVMLIIGIILAAIGLIGMFRGEGRKKYIQYGRGRKIYY